jgi:hypothetical protein
MPTLDENSRAEYAALMSRGRDAERTAQMCWSAGGVSSAVLLSWGIAAKNPGLMIPVVLAIAVGFYATLRSRQQVRLIAGYVREFYESRGGLQWFSRIHRLHNLASFTPVGDWLTVSLTNAVVLVSILLAWVYAPAAARGDLMAGIVTGFGVVFGFHSVSETLRVSRGDTTSMWKQVSGELREEETPARANFR